MGVGEECRVGGSGCAGEKVERGHWEREREREEEEEEAQWNRMWHRKKMNRVS